MNVLTRYNAALEKRAQEEKRKALAAKELGDEREHSIHRMQESMLGDMLRQLGKAQHEGRRPNLLQNLMADLEKEEEKQKSFGDYDAADRAKIKRETVFFALACLQEEENRQTAANQKNENPPSSKELE